MSGRRDDSLLLDDMITSAERLIEILKRVGPGGLERSRQEKEMAQWNLLVLGEATKRLTPATRERFSDVNWTSMAKTRDRIVHHYEGVLWWLVEEIIVDELPELLPRLVEIRDLVRAEFDATDA